MVKQPILFGLMAHELGHTLGLRHNFSGSYDAVNYRPGYWELRDDGKIASRAEDPMTDAEVNGRIREYQYSTVMDYGHNFVVTDAQGIGHYDVAAIKMGYGDIAEVFTDAPQENAVGIASIDAQASPFMVFQVDPPRGDQDNELRAFHYSSWPTLVGGVGNISKRKDVRYRDLGFVASPLFGGGGRGLYQDGDALLPVVPYLYCGDEYADSRPPCNRYDAGADPYEVMQSIIDNYWNYYPFSHFMRGRIGWDPSSVVNRSADRYYMPLMSMAQIYALYRQFYEPFLGTTFFEDSEGFGLFTLGVRASYDLFRRVVSTPEPAGLLYEQLADGTTLLSEDGTEAPLIPKSIDAFSGRFLRSYYEIGPANEWVYFTSSGWFKEKALALQILMYADTGYLGVDTSPDVREYSSSYYTSFPDSMSSFLSAIFASDYEAYGPRLKDGALFYPNPQDVVNHGMAIDAQGSDLVSPNLGFTLQLTAMAFGTLLSPNTFDQDFVNRSRLFAQGSSEAVTPANPVTYVDSRSGLTYVASSYPVTRDGKTVETGSAAAMIAYANGLQAKIAKAQLDGDTDKAARTQATLDDFVDNLDALRYLTNILGHGSNGQFFGF
ncbi:MAG: zinc-dependent metalloprotease [Myxococcales bacterium]